MAKYRIEKDPSLKHGLVKYKDNGEKYIIVDIGNKMYWKNTRTNQYEHIEVVEEKYGTLAEGSIVHHKDEDGLNNDEDNLEVCRSRHDHQMVHIKENALAACGHADWRRCIYCGKYDDPQNMDVSKRRDRGEDARKYRHKACYSEYKKEWWANRTPEQVEKERKKKAEAYQARKKKLKKTDS